MGWLERAEAIPGWMNRPELLWLHETAKGMQSILEVGSLFGRSAYALASGCRGPVVCCDTWSTPGSRESFLHYTEDVPNIHPYQATSWELLRDFSPYAWFDMVFLDGDHSYEGVKADIGELLPRTRVLLCGHDFSEEGGFPGVKQALDEVLPGRYRQEALPGVAAEDSPIWSHWVS